MARALLDYVVLDTLANDLESLEGMVRLANHPEIGWQTLHGGPLDRPTIVSALLRVLCDQLVEAYALGPTGGDLERLPPGAVLSGSLDDYWFGLSARGRMVHEAWDPRSGPEVGQEPIK